MKTIQKEKQVIEKKLQVVNTNIDNELWNVYKEKDQILLDIYNNLPDKDITILDNPFTIRVIRGKHIKYAKVETMFKWNDTCYYIAIHNISPSKELIFIVSSSDILKHNKAFEIKK